MQLTLCCMLLLSLWRLHFISVFSALTNNGSLFQSLLRYEATADSGAPKAAALTTAGTKLFEEATGVTAVVTKGDDIDWRDWRHGDDMDDSGIHISIYSMTIGAMVMIGGKKVMVVRDPEPESVPVPHAAVPASMAAVVDRVADRVADFGDRIQLQHRHQLQRSISCV